MSHLFCHSCGTKLSYAHAQPNFCAKCGQPLNSSTASSHNTAEGLNTLKESVVVSQDETDASSVPSIGKLQVEYDTSDHNSFTLGSLVGEKGEANPRKRAESRSINEYIDEKKTE
jgi:predicted amidophosphoribosyltransferase